MSSLSISKPTSFSTAEPSLSSRAMLCSLSISTWSVRKHDPEAPEEIASRHGARPDAGRYHKMPSSQRGSGRYPEDRQRGPSNCRRIRRKFQPYIGAATTIVRSSSLSFGSVTLHLVRNARWTADSHCFATVQSPRAASALSNRCDQHRSSPRILHGYRGVGGK